MASWYWLTLQPCLCCCCDPPQPSHVSSYCVSESPSVAFGHGPPPRQHPATSCISNMGASTPTPTAMGRVAGGSWHCCYSCYSCSCCLCCCCCLRCPSGGHGRAGPMSRAGICCSSGEGSTGMLVLVEVEPHLDPLGERPLPLVGTPAAAVV